MVRRVGGLVVPLILVGALAGTLQAADWLHESPAIVLLFLVEPVEDGAGLRVRYHVVNVTTDEELSVATRHRVLHLDESVYPPVVSLFVGLPPEAAEDFRGYDFIPEPLERLPVDRTMRREAVVTLPASLRTAPRPWTPCVKGDPRDIPMSDGWDGFRVLRGRRVRFRLMVGVGAGEFRPRQALPAEKVREYVAWQKLVGSNTVEMVWPELRSTLAGP